jgi:hypothetical protein
MVVLPVEQWNRFGTSYTSPMTPKTSKPLALRIKREYLQQIVAGTKKIEYRDNVKHYTLRFCERLNGEIFYNMWKSKGFRFKKIDSLRLYVSSKEYAIVELKKITLPEPYETYFLHLGKVLIDKSDERL